MDRLVFSNLSAMRSSMGKQHATANNLANANTPGFRADISEASSLWITGPGANSRAFASGEVLTFDRTPGAITQTGRPLDIAIGGDGLLAVQAENGDEAYTRRGDLNIAPTGLLVTGDGHPVLGDVGPIIVDPTSDITIDQSGGVWSRPAGQPDAPPVQVDQLKLVSPAGSNVEKGLDGLIREVNGGALPGDPEGSVISGALEGSNVSVSQALVDMIEASRTWETQLNMISSARDLDSSGADLMRMPK